MWGTKANLILAGWNYFFTLKFRYLNVKVRLSYHCPLSFLLYFKVFPLLKWKQSNVYLPWKSLSSRTNCADTMTSVHSRCSQVIWTHKMLTLLQYPVPLKQALHTLNNRLNIADILLWAYQTCAIKPLQRQTNTTIQLLTLTKTASTQKKKKKWFPCGLHCVILWMIYRSYLISFFFLCHLKRRFKHFYF